MVVLPAPVGPTMATVWPGLTVNDRPSMSGRSSSYRNETSSKATCPCTCSGRIGSAASGDCSSASSSSKTRSAEATPDCTRLAIEATCVSGWLNWREYCTNAWTSPIDSAPLATRSPPTTATST